MATALSRECDAALYVSDHADISALLNGAQATPARQVFTLSLSLTSVSHASLFASVSLIWMVTLALTLTLTLALTLALTPSPNPSPNP